MYERKVLSVDVFTLPPRGGSLPCDFGFFAEAFHRCLRLLCLF